MRKDMGTEGIEYRFVNGNFVSAKYKEEYCSQMIEYFTSDDTKYPTFERFAANLGVTYQTLKNWAGKYSRFNTALNICRNFQSGKLQALAMEGVYNPAFAKFVAVNCHGFKDKSDTDSNITVSIKTPPDIDEESN